MPRPSDPTAYYLESADRWTDASLSHLSPLVRAAVMRTWRAVLSAHLRAGSRPWAAVRAADRLARARAVRLGVEVHPDLAGT